jgi:ATP-dependent exoDNAse (exonuclease V) alpha subunit
MASRHVRRSRCQGSVCWTEIAVYRRPDAVITFIDTADLYSGGESERITKQALKNLSVDPVEQEISIRFDDRRVKHDFGELDEVSLAYAVTIHKSQGSEFPAVVIPLATQHYMLLQRNLIYTGITRGKKLVMLIGQKKALGIAVHNDRPQRRYSGLLVSLRSHEQRGVS